MSMAEFKGKVKNIQDTPFGYTLSVIGGMVKRTEYPQVPPKVEYSLMEKVGTLLPVLEDLCEWGVKNQGAKRPVLA
ncbi:helix-turn-helix transcriptional regulator [Paenibacillus alba]|uniref:winged helix-turn-helix transcriptional regulator n=1 Tax=Paenibacillus alba TaxID=1197127 RepID=UPI00156775D3|nr:winged helix-turn-helix transcriptional regulator [Paenibacillus alba]NQX66307.1 helix-turn-helix transcriptional regulator [Paenibacillus alba]